MYKLTLVSIYRSGVKRTSVFMHLPVINGKVHMPEDMIKAIPRGCTFVIGG